MAKIELRDSNIFIQDGLAGTAVSAAALTAGATSATINTVVLNTAVTNLVPVGARFTIVGEAGLPIHTVLTRTPTSVGPTTAITFTPAIAAGGTLISAVINFLPQRVFVKVGEGNITYTEAREIEYVLDRGNLDSTREGNEQPLAVNLQFLYEYVRTGTNLIITPSDAIKGIGGASGWVSAGIDTCEPYACDIVMEYKATCSGVAQQAENTTFQIFRWDSLQFDLSAATIAVQGRCNKVAATIVRV